MKKTTPPALYGVKKEFYESLDAALHQAIMLHDAVQSAIQLGMMQPGAQKILEIRCEALNKALYVKEDV